MEQSSSGAVGFREVDQHGNPVDPSAGGQEAAGLQHKPAGTGPNPFIAALWALSLALLVGGTWVLTANVFNPATVSGPAPVSFLVLTYAPQAILAGLATAVGLLFWHASQWQRRRAQHAGAQTHAAGH